MNTLHEHHSWFSRPAPTQKKQTAQAPQRNNILWKSKQRLCIVSQTTTLRKFAAKLRKRRRLGTITGDNVSDDSETLPQSDPEPAEAAQDLIS